LKTIIRPLEQEAKSALSPKYYASARDLQTPLWTPGHWLTVMKTLAKSKTGFVKYSEMKDAIGSQAEEALASMLDLHLLSYRPTHSLSGDIPFEGEEGFVARSPGLHYAIRFALKNLPFPLLFVKARKIGFPSFMKVPLEELTLECLKDSIAHRFNRPAKELISIEKLGSDYFVTSDRDVLELNNLQELEVQFQLLRSNESLEQKRLKKRQEAMQQQSENN